METNNMVSDDALRAMWRAAGGHFYGPQVETGAMPEGQLLLFLRSLVTQKAATVPPTLTLTQMLSACLHYRHDFGLLSSDDQNTILFEAQQWEWAFRKEWEQVVKQQAEAAGDAKEHTIPELNAQVASLVEDKSATFGVFNSVQAEFRCECEGGIVGTAAVPIKSVSIQDDGTLLVTLDYWPPVK